jgi:hypothetical protein
MGGTETLDVVQEGSDVLTQSKGSGAVVASGNMQKEGHQGQKKSNNACPHLILLNFIAFFSFFIFLHTWLNPILDPLLKDFHPSRSLSMTMRGQAYSNHLQTRLLKKNENAWHANKKLNASLVK